MFVVYHKPWKLDSVLDTSVKGSLVILIVAEQSYAAEIVRTYKKMCLLT